MEYETVITSFEEANELKEQARVSKDNVAFYKMAADKYKEAGDDYSIFIRKLKGTSDIHLHKAFQEYYYHEGEECLSAYYYENHNHEHAMRHNERSIININKSIEELIKSKDNIQSDKHLEIWKYFRETTKLFKYNIEARYNWDKGNYVCAIDCYKTVLRGYEMIKSQVIDLTEKNKLPQVFLRISQGNHYGMKFNIASAYAAMITNDASLYDSYDGVLEVLQFLVDAIESAKKAFKENPEWAQYKEGVPIYRGNIRLLLENNKKYWKMLIVDLENDYITSLMLELDESYYRSCKNVNNQGEEQANMKRKGFLSVLFAVLLAVAILSAMYTFIVERVGVLGTIAIVSAALILITIISVITFRQTNDLSEDNFTSIVKTVLRDRFNFLRKK